MVRKKKRDAVFYFMQLAIKKASSSYNESHILISLFSLSFWEENATDTVDELRSHGIIAVRDVFCR